MIYIYIPNPLDFSFIIISKTGTFVASRIFDIVGKAVNFTLTVENCWGSNTYSKPMDLLLTERRLQANLFGLRGVLTRPDVDM